MRDMNETLFEKFSEFSQSSHSQILRTCDYFISRLPLFTHDLFSNRENNFSNFPHEVTMKPRRSRLGAEQQMRTQRELSRARVNENEKNNPRVAVLEYFSSQLALAYGIS